MSNAKLPPANTPAIWVTGEEQSFTVSELLVNRPTFAALLGCSVCTVDTLIERKRIPVIRLRARCHRFDVAGVLALKG